MTSLSAIILTSNREDVIEDCLKSLDWVDEKIVVDLGCYDKSLEIAKKYKSKIIKGDKDYNLKDSTSVTAKYNFSKWRNQGAGAAKGNWLFYIDTDERVSAELAAEIKSKIKNQKSKIKGYYIPRKNYFFGKEFKKEWPDYQLRLIKKKALVSWLGKVHETPKIKGRLGHLKSPLIHQAHRNLEACIANTLNWSKLEAELRYKAGHPKMTVFRFFSILFKGFKEQFIKKKLWKEGVEGVIEGIYQVFSLFFTYVRLWEMQNKKKKLK